MTQNPTQYLLFAFDEGFRGPGMVAVSTALAHTSPDVHVIVGSVRLEKATIDRLRALGGGGRVEIVEITDLVDAIPGHPRFPAATWARIFVDKIVPETAERVVYLDGDTFTRSSITDLIDVDLHGFTIGACASRRYPTQAERGVSIGSGPTPLPATAYFNVGVLVIDMVRWRDLEVSTRLLRLAQTDVSASTLPDQDALNVALWDDWYPLPASLWNYPGSLTLRGSEFARIVHFYGLVKPWEVAVPAMHLQREFVQAAAAVGWEIRLSPLRRIRRLLRDLTPVGLLERRYPCIPPREVGSGDTDS